MEATIKDVEKLGEILSSLTPASAKLLAYILFTKKYKEPFKLTYFRMTDLSGVANPHRAMTGIVDAGFIKRTKTFQNECEYTLLIDLIK